MHRLTTSAMHGRALGADGQWTSTLIYGRNTHADHQSSNSVLIESEAIIDKHNTLFGRVELVQKSAIDLQLTGVAPDQLFNVKALSLGYIRELARGHDVTFGIGARGTVNLVPSPLETVYGSRTPVGGMVFLRLRPYHSPHEAMQMNPPTQPHYER
jgi:hypothetical protein